MNRSFLFATAIFLASLLTGCATQNLFTTTTAVAPKMSTDTAFRYNATYQYTIRTDDKISVSVWDHDELSVGSVFGIYNSNEVYGKWVMVDARGDVQLPKLGNVKLRGLTVMEAEDTLIGALKKWIVNPVVKVKVLNKEVTILGELRTPGKYLLERDNNTLLDVIGKAGDFDFYANKKAVQVMRTVHNQQQLITLDLTAATSFGGANVQIQPGDVIYVPSRKGKHWDRRAGSTIVPLASAISTAVLVGRLVL